MDPNFDLQSTPFFPGSSQDDLEAGGNVLSSTYFPKKTTSHKKPEYPSGFQNNNIHYFYPMDQNVFDLYDFQNMMPDSRNEFEHQ